MTVMSSDIPFIVLLLESFDVDGLSRHDLFWPKTVHNRWNAAEWNDLWQFTTGETLRSGMTCDGSQPVKRCGVECTGLHRGPRTADVGTVLDCAVDHARLKQSWNRRLRHRGNFFDKGERLSGTRRTSFGLVIMMILATKAFASICIIDPTLVVLQRQLNTGKSCWTRFLNDKSGDGFSVVAHGERQKWKLSQC